MARERSHPLVQALAAGILLLLLAPVCLAKAERPPSTGKQVDEATEPAIAPAAPSTPALAPLKKKGNLDFLSDEELTKLPGQKATTTAKPIPSDEELTKLPGQKEVTPGEGEKGPAGSAAAPSDEEFGLALGGTEEGGGTTFSLDDCVRMALERNQRIKAAGYDVEAAQGQLMESKATLWPVMEYTYRAAPVPTDVNNAWHDFWDGQVTMFNSIKIGIGVPLITFGQLEAARNMAMGGLNAARVNQGKSRANVIYQVKQLYYGVQLAHESIKLLNEAIGKISDKVSSTEAKAKPDMDPYDLLQLKGFRLELERRLDEAQQNLELAYEGLRIQLNLEPMAPVELDSDTLTPLLATLDREEQFVDTGMALQPEVKLLDIGVEVKRQQYRLEKFKLLPKIGFGFYMDVGRSVGPITGLTLTDDFNNPFNYTRAGVGLQLQGTLDFHGAASRIKKARAEYYKATYDRLIARRGLSLDIRRAYLEAKRAQANLARAKKADSMSRQMMFITKVNVDMGIGDQQRYADALKYVMVTRALYFKSIFDYNMALSDLEQRIGEAAYREVVPVPDVETYDAFNGDEDDEGFITIEEGNGNASSNQKSNGKKTHTPLP